jgi:2,4-dienoyl-CoA reductase-like NADH-dependent reductase (Old Yellow Enzyme family)
MIDYQKLNNEITLKCGVKLLNRIAMAPMTTKGSDYNGFVGQEDLEFYGCRSNAAGLLITGAASVSKTGEAFSYQLSISDDMYIENLKKLANLMKKDGNKAIVQIYHGGRKSEVSFNNLGYVLSPSYVKSNMNLRVLEEKQILEIIDDFAKATRRAIEAGFDGVEIHGANHHLIQQFFSTYSNYRADKWGGSIEKRMRFSLEIVKKVQQVIVEMGLEQFIIGYRITQSEIHGDIVGYSIDESIQLIDKLSNLNLDYIHISRSEFGKRIKDKINNRTTLIYTANVIEPIDALKALEIGDIIAIGRAIVLEPEFALKIKNNDIKSIRRKIDFTSDISQLKLPEKLINWFQDKNSNIPKLPTI